MVTTERRDAIGGRRAAADDGVSGRSRQQRDDCGEWSLRCFIHEQ